MSVIAGLGISWDIALRWLPLNLADDKSTLVQLMAGCRQAITWTNVDWNICRHMASQGTVSEEHTLDKKHLRCIKIYTS